MAATPPPLPPPAAAARLAALEQAVSGTVLGQAQAVRETLACLVAGGHALLEGPPGVGKTLLVRALAAATGLSFSRVQFTPDLLPADVTGTHVLLDLPEGRRFVFQRGPLFGNLVLADEINRATPRTQAALLEAMAEQAVSAGSERIPLPAPFCVLATQNPIEMEGTFPLPEAQLDRFLLKVQVAAPDEAALVAIFQRTAQPEPTLPGAVLAPGEVASLQAAARAVLLPEPLARQVARLVLATDPGSAGATDSARRNLRLGASPRAGEAICRVARAAALAAGCDHVRMEDLAFALAPALRHRLLPSFEAEARGLVGDRLVADVLAPVAGLPREVQRVLSAIEPQA
ncbi:MAG: AAA family ATPase [Planctomycetia bacterium]